MRLIHLSDVHFGLRVDSGKSKSMHRFTSAGGKPDTDALAAILARDQEARSAQVVVVSGDLGWSGANEDYAFALQALRRIREVVTGEIALCPGNHDVNLAPGVDYDKRQEAYEKLLGDFYGDQLEAIYPALADTSARLDRRERLIALHSYPGALVVTVNSCALQDFGSTPIAVTPPVLEYVEQLLEAHESSSSVIRVFVLHHHLFPFVELPWDDQFNVREVSDRPDPTMLGNATRVQHWLTRNDFDVVLHGHKHMHHGREDRLWRPSGSPRERRLVIIGAGSAGVSNDQRPHSEPNSYNVIDAIPTARGAWRVQVDARKIDDSLSPVSAVPWFQYSATAGRDYEASTYAFSAERMDDCHAELSRALENSGRPIRNFTSVVEDSQYIHPETIRDGADHPTVEDVERCFRGLHPEYSADTGWDSEEAVDDLLSHRRDRLEHGSRLFRKSQTGMSPIASAIQFVQTRPTWAYVGLYRPTLDTDLQPRPMPGLMGIQLIPRSEDRKLDIVATFRNLELSFWWVVNMLELRRLLEYSGPRCSRALNPGSVTMFAALAEWKRNPEPVNVPRLDEMTLSETLALAAGVREKRAGAAEILAELLEEKADATSPYYIEVVGLRNLIASFDAVQEIARRGSRDLVDISAQLKQCRTNLTLTERSRTADRSSGAQLARNHLAEAARLLREVSITRR